MPIGSTPGSGDKDNVHNLLEEKVKRMDLGAMSRDDLIKMLTSMSVNELNEAERQARRKWHELARQKADPNAINNAMLKMREIIKFRSPGM